MSTDHRHARRRLDEFVRAGYHSLILSTAPARRTFTRLLHWVRVRSSLLTPIGDSELLGRAVGALASLARYHERYVAQPETWAGGEGNVYELVQSLAEHLLGGFSVPRCLATVWLEPYSEAVRQAREWFITHARGQRFRAIADLPIAMTRKMERLWLSSPHHFSVRKAMRRAELLALGAKPPLVEAVLGTKLGESLAHGKFWRECLHWLVNHQHELDGRAVAEIIEFVDAQRFSTTTIVTPTRVLREPPPNPEFRLAGRTLDSLARLMFQWQRRLTLLQRGASHWSPTGFAGLMFREHIQTADTGTSAPVEWQIIELLDSKQLRQEGAALRHCVGSYTSCCLRGESSIWSLRRRTPGGAFARRYTIEVNPARAMIVQVKGFSNRAPREHIRSIIARWAELAGLQLSY